MGIARGWEKRVIRTNITYAKRTVRIFRVSPQSRSLFSASFKAFCLTARAYLNTQKYGLFCSLTLLGVVVFSVLLEFDSRTRTTTRTTFNFKFSHLFSKVDTTENFIELFSPTKLVGLFTLKEVKPSPDR